MFKNTNEKAEQEDHHKWRYNPTRHLLKTVAVQRPLCLVTEKMPGSYFSFKVGKYIN